MEVDKLTELYPQLFHMAEDGTWPSIEKHGLMSTKAVLDRSRLSDPQKQRLEFEQRASKVEVPMASSSSIVLRDQIPMPRKRLEQALKNGIEPEKWYQLINSKVFFWTNEERLTRLLKARMYRELSHDVLVIDTKSLLRTNSDRVWLCHMNSGNTFPVPHERGFDIFQRVQDYPVNSKGNPRKPVVELVVDYEVQDLADHVVDVKKMCGDDL